jgi:hypothetical protein
MLPELRAALPDAVFTGTLPHAEVATAFASADVFVVPSRTDTAGNVVLEAQASGVPVLVSDVGGPRENLSPGASGLVVAGTGAAPWADALASLIADPVRRHAMSAAAREYGLSRSWERAARAALPHLSRARRGCTGDSPVHAAARIAAAPERRRAGALNASLLRSLRFRAAALLRPCAPEPLRFCAPALLR